MAGVGLTAHGAYEVASGLQDLQNAVEGTDYGGPAEQLGAAIAGESGRNIGEAADKALTVLGGYSSSKFSNWNCKVNRESCR